MDHLHQSGLYGSVARQKPPIVKDRYKKVPVKKLKKTLGARGEKHSMVWWDQDLTLWAKFRALCLTKTNTIPTVKHGVGNIMACEYISVTWTRRLVRIEGKKNAAKYSEVLAHSLRLGQRFTFNHNNRVALRQVSECLWVAQSKPRLEWPHGTSLERH